MLLTPRATCPATLLALLAVSVASADDKQLMFQDMDYGPVMAYTIQADWPKHNGNLAYKGLAIKLDGGKAGVLFDMDLMRVAAAWTNDTGKPYLDLSKTNMTSYKGSGLAMPRGTKVFGTQVVPGWASDKLGNFDDGREPPHGVLPQAHTRFKGFYVHGDRVTLAYDVRGTRVLETHDTYTINGVTHFTRKLDIAPHKKTLYLMLLEQPGATRSTHAGSIRGTTVVATPDGQSDSKGKKLGQGTTSISFKGLRLTSETQGKAINTHITVYGTDREIHFHGHGDRAGRAVLQIWPSDQRRQLTVLISQQDAERQSLTADVLRRPDFDRLTNGGPRRWDRSVVTSGSKGAQNAPYALDRLTCPEDNPYKSWIRPTGFDFFPDGTSAAVSTWNGDVWIVRGIDDDLKKLTWQRFAAGLHEPLGVVVHNGDVYTTGRDQITRLRDLNGDGEADFYESFNNHGITWPRTMAMELHKDAEGNLYYIKNGNRVPGNVPLQGCIFKVSPDGKTLSVYATGFRSANGLSVSPTGQVTIADQEGNWVPTTRLDLVQQNKFYGYRPHAHGMVPANPKTPDTVDYELPLCWIPKVADNSAGGQAWITSDKWGPFKGRLVHTSYGKAMLYLVMYEKVEGVTQGGLVRFPIDFDTGIMRARVNPRDGQLYVLGMRGWQTDGPRDSGFYRVRYTGKPINMPTQINVKPDGVLLTFTDALDKTSASNVENYGVERWNYVYSSKYGSPEYSVENPRRKGHDTVDVESAEVSADGKQVLLRIPDIAPVMQQSITFDLKAADGSRVKHTVYHTIHRVPKK